MSISISSRTSVFVAQTQARPGPKAILQPRQELLATAPVKGEAIKAPVNVPASAPSSAPVRAPDRVDFGATIDTQTAQDPPGTAQEGIGDGPERSPGLVDGDSIFGDITGDGTLTRDDITALLKAFNSSVTAADLNADGNVDTADLGLLINAIRELNAKNRPDDTPSDGPGRDLKPQAVMDIPLDRDQEPTTSPGPGFADLDPGDNPGGDDPVVAQPGVFGDLTGDGVVNGDDLAMLQQSFGQSGAVGDLNGDGRVDTADLGAMLGILSRSEDA